MAEYYAAAAVAEELTKLRAVFEFLEYEVECYLYMDSVVARELAKRKGVGKVEGLEDKTLRLRHEVKRRRLTLSTVPTDNNLTDLGTKVLASARLRELRCLCGSLLPGETRSTGDAAKAGGFYDDVLTYGGSGAVAAGSASSA
eukprot:7714958-Heterocapsa_arctica.AAC.1